MGVDPFYRGLRWEVQPEQCEEESGGSKGRKGEPAFSAVAYVREWGDLAYKAVGKPSPLPLELHKPLLPTKTSKV